jgi:hypothetical protein
MLFGVYVFSLFSCLYSIPSCVSLPNFFFPFILYKVSLLHLLIAITPLEFEAMAHTGHSVVDTLHKHSALFAFD